MGFFSGRVTLQRFQVAGAAPDFFGPQQLEQLGCHAIGTSKIAAADGVDYGWTAAKHILDKRFEQEKNVINDMLFFALRIDQDKIPGDVLKAYYEIDLKAMAFENPSGKPSVLQKREAKESARDRLEHEAKDGRYLKRKAIEVVWDLKCNDVYFGATSLSQIDRLMIMFKNTFGLELKPTSAGSALASLGNPDIVPSQFVPGSAKDVAWVLDSASKDFLGNEFLLWLWFRSQVEDDTFDLGDGSQAAVMLSSNITLDCPRGQTGHDTIKHEGPTRLPEAKRAIQSGKLPRKAGMTIVRHDEQYSFTLLAESLAISGAKLPASEEEDAQARLVDRSNKIRGLIESVDLLFKSFLEIRTSSAWSVDFAKMQGWLADS